MLTRCAVCHTADPGGNFGVYLPPKGVVLDSPEAVRRHAHEIGLQAVWSHAMPPGGNVTEIPDEDRATIAAWLAAGAPAD